MDVTEVFLQKLQTNKEHFFDFGLDEELNRAENAKYNRIIKNIFTPCNFKLWMKKKLWTVHETSVIVLGFEPSVFLAYEKKYQNLKEQYNEKFLYADWQIYCDIAYFTAKRISIMKEIERGIIEKIINVINSKDRSYVDAQAICCFFIERGICIPNILSNFRHPVTIWKEFLEKEQNMKTKKRISVFIERKTLGTLEKELASKYNVTERTILRWLKDIEQLRQKKGLPSLPVLENLKMS